MECKSIILRSPLDEGIPGPEHFEVILNIIDPHAMCFGDVLVQALVFSADPYLRGQIKTTGAGVFIRIR